MTIEKLCFPVLSLAMLSINIFVLVYCFETVLKTKKKAVAVFCVFAVLMLIPLFIFTRLGYSGQVLFYSQILSFFLPFYFTTKGALAGKTFLFFTQIYIMNVIFYLSGLITEVFAEYGSYLYYALFISVVLGFYVIYVVLTIYRGKNVCSTLFAYTDNRIWFLYSVLPMCSFFVLKEYYFITASIIPLSITRDPFHILLPIFMLAGFVFVIIAIINSHHKIAARYEAEHSREIISTGRDHYQKMNEMYETISILRHDYKHHLNTISELARTGNIDEIKKHLADTQVRLPDDDLRFYCNNPVLNALFASYSERCAREHITYEVQLSMPETLSIPNYDMCIILGNLLENAMEACMKKERGRKIELSIKTQGSHLAVMVKNSYNGVMNEENGQPASAKKDGGYGLRSIGAVIARYDGHMLTEWDDDTFTAYVLLKIRGRKYN